MITEIEKAIEAVAKSIQRHPNPEHAESLANAARSLANAIALLENRPNDTQPSCEPSEAPHQFTPFEEKLIQRVQSMVDQIRRDQTPEQEECDEVDFLFIGGPMDGFRHSVDPKQEEFQYISKYESAVYAKQSIHSYAGHCQFFALKGMEPIHVMEYLLSRYTREPRNSE